MKVADYKELRVYQLSFESAMEVFALSKTFPVEERYSLADQVRRSTRSICANIAEAWRKRRYEAAFVSELSDADAEAAETEVHLDFAWCCGYIKPEAHAKLKDRYDHICRQLTKMMSDSSSWCTLGNVIREDLAEYVVASPPSDAPNTPRSDAPNAPRSDAPNAPDAPRS
jgi:four helix bundle protein